MQINWIYLPILEFLELRGLATDTLGKKICNCEYSKLTSFPLNILATKVPPLLSTWNVMFKAARSNWDWMYSSISCRPVTGTYNTHKYLAWYGYIEIYWKWHRTSCNYCFTVRFNWEPLCTYKEKKVHLFSLIKHAIKPNSPGDCRHLLFL